MAAQKAGNWRPQDELRNGKWMLSSRQSFLTQRSDRSGMISKGKRQKPCRWVSQTTTAVKPPIGVHFGYGSVHRWPQGKKNDSVYSAATIAPEVLPESLFPCRCVPHPVHNHGYLWRHSPLLHGASPGTVPQKWVHLSLEENLSNFQR